MSGEVPFHPALRRITSPADENHQGTVFGGVILSLIDQAGYVEARRHGLHRWVTASIDRVDFIAPVYTGDILALSTGTEHAGRSSVRVRVVVEAERWRGGETVKVTEAVLTMVAIGPDGRSVDFRSPPRSEP
ncbi:MAG: acyl-CoA thioesterase [Phycisphaeraceae bacterium]|nr:acyl-CoA thioesterase [Phycisphaeraceae bacterium]